MQRFALGEGQAREIAGIEQQAGGGQVLVGDRGQRLDLGGERRPEPVEVAR